MNEIGARLKYFRKQKGLSLRTLGKLAHVSHSFIADIESGRSKPSLDTIQSLVKALDISFSELVEDTAFLTKTYGTFKIRNENVVCEELQIYEYLKEINQREDLQLLFKQIRRLSPESIRRVIRYIKMVEDEESKSKNI
ncbi:helix-turn-helix domain-containing protein [Desulfoscipio geothermicus]|uniref:Helix-turn-helix n=1 Tax=Desulfoscipio geothermicus DSM 3669 TaxID=1121426 RepID=A0A1I6D512_9FIRM|nr:helix-turn-helix transcriptional regulator [Desulfoscipio geothermicus]SFR00483.1 Helix-turn-helix [Desulfoscipio geothermicus DSM 3669]